MPITARTTEELGKALKTQPDEIIIEGDAKTKTIRIRAIGKVAWVVAFGAIAVAVTGIIVTAGSGGAAAPATISIGGPAFIVAGGAAGGISVVTSAISIAVAAGGVGALTTLRKKYKIIEREKVTMLVKK